MSLNLREAPYGPRNSTPCNKEYDSIKALKFQTRSLWIGHKRPWPRLPGLLGRVVEHLGHLRLDLEQLLVSGGAQWGFPKGGGSPH